MTQDDRAFLFDYLRTPSPTGQEVNGQKLWRERISPFADELRSDSYGNCWATLKGTNDHDGPTVMIEAHADEIGFMIQYIDDDGFIYISPAGGSDATITRAKRITFFGKHGPVHGVIGSTAIHLRKDDAGSEKVPKWHEVFVDIGATSKDDVLQRGLHIGCYAVYHEGGPLELTEGKITGRAIDNRISGFLLTKVFEQLKDNRPAATVVALNSVQEEVGGYGARMAAYEISPDIALVFDVTHATDTPGIDQKKFGAVKLGAGPAVTHGTANHPLLVKRLIDLADKNELPLQHESASRYTGTDTDDIFITKSGIPSVLLSIPLRYMHSPVEMMDEKDFENTLRLTLEFLRSFQPGERVRIDLT